MKKIAISAALLFVFAATDANATQADITGPAGSELFGWTVTVLPNGNIDVTDPDYDLPSPTVSPEIAFERDAPFRGRTSFR